jgi:ribonuclease D
MESIITTAEDLARCCEHLSELKRFGFDTEFVGEESYTPTLCLVQVATAERLYLIDPLAVGPLDAFWKVLTDPAHQVVVHAGREEVRLCRFWTGQAPSNLCDLQIAAGLVGLQYHISHGNLIYELLGTRLAKGETLTEWRTRPLTRDQIRYAFDDVRYLLPAHDALAGRLKQLDRQDWAAEEFARLADTVAEDTTREKWRKLPGLGRLERRKLAIARELFAWREGLAAKLNRPPRTIVRDDLLVEIAKRNPQREQDLHVVRGLAHRHAGEILAAIGRARALPPSHHPELAERDNDPPQHGLLVQLLTAVLADFCTRRRLASSLAATSSDLKQLVRAKIQGTSLPDDTLLGSGWRARHILPELEAVLSGDKRIRVEDVRREAPLGDGSER